MMTLKNGKFWNNGEIVPIEHGNTAQIALLNKVQTLRSSGLLLRGNPKDYFDEFNTILCFSHLCICGEKMLLEYPYKQVYSIDERIKCPGCQLGYSLESFEQSDSFIVIKIITKKS